MSKIQKITTEDWTDLPLHTVLFEWLNKNVAIPSDLSKFIAYIAMFIILWYTIVWTTRFVISIIWPLFLITTAIVVFRVLQYYDLDELIDLIKHSCAYAADTFVTAMAKTLEVILKFFE
ncbi:uncharacterized protein LOC101892780 [Musca domestica]|uniref:Uncharacterized protein LOC101892780 n=1 Tax=Musca domestica TaxID=7370 RepID=A0A1I8N369_MUSDO|nr:uncharacterized protein LOC101892780 [Musca domestica]XP_011291018.1 uncharacterized protein LOC101892780 [Musca domestica]